jgi:hypothetical protein
VENASGSCIERLIKIYPIYQDVFRLVLYLLNMINKSILIIFLLLFCLPAFSQTKKTKKTTTNCYSYQNGFCLTKICLNLDFTFTQIMSCESHQTITIGNFISDGDSLILNSKKIDDLILYTIKESDLDSPGRRVRFMDKFGNPVHGFAIYQFDCNSAKSYQQKSDFISSEDGYIELKSETCLLELIPFSLIFGQETILDLTKYRTNITIVLNFNSQWIGGYDVEYKAYQRPVKFQQNNGSLLRFNQQFMLVE